MTRLPRNPRFQQAMLVLLAYGLFGASAPSRAATAADSLFAPVEAQQSARLARIAALPSGPLSPDQLDLMLDAGRIDEATAALPRLTGDARATTRVRLRLALTRQDFAAVPGLMNTLLAHKDLTPEERSLRDAWDFARDDLATVDRRTASMVPADPAQVGAQGIPELLAAAKLAFALQRYARSESCVTRVIALTEGVTGPGYELNARANAFRGLAQVRNQLRHYDEALDAARQSLALGATPEALRETSESLIHLGRTDEAITCCEWGIRLNPYHDVSHYYLGNGYARKTYSELFRSQPAAFADSAGRRAIAHADSLLAAGNRRGARAAYDVITRAHPGWADVRVRLASLNFEDGRYASARDRCFEALRLAPEYGRAHAVLAKSLESQRFAVDVHRPDYEKRFAASPEPAVPGIERYVLNWNSLSPRHQKRVALSVVRWKQFVPVLNEGGSHYFIKPLYMLLSEVPGLETLRDTRISYDSRLWDDVRGAGGFTTVTGIEDVERTIFDRYNTVLHEMTHQVHGVLTTEQVREIQDLYRRAKTRDEATHDGFLSQYAGGSVYEYFAEGANALGSPKRDAWDPREVVLERLQTMDPALLALVKRDMALTNVDASYSIAYTNAGDDQVGKGDVKGGLGFYDRALMRAPTQEQPLSSRTRALILAGARDSAIIAASRALAAHPESGDIVANAADAMWYGGRGIDSALTLLRDARPRVVDKDRDKVDLRIGALEWTRGNGANAAAAYDAALASQSDLPEALWGKAAALALDKRWSESFALYEQAVRSRTGIAALRCDYARDLIRAGRSADAGTQLDAAFLLDPEHPQIEALRGWLALESGRPDSAAAHAQRALAFGDWCDLARIVLGRAQSRMGQTATAEATLAPLRERIAKNTPPSFVYRAALADWVSVHETPALEREMIATPGNGQASAPRKRR